MGANKRHAAARSGPVTLDVELSAGQIRVVTHPGCDRAEIRVMTADDTGPAAELVNDTRISDTGGRIGVRVPSPKAGTSTVFQSFGSGVSAIQVGRGMVFAGDAVVVGGTVVGGQAAVEIQALLPVGSSLAAQTVSGDVVTVGPLARVDASLKSGDATIEDVVHPIVKTISGDVRIGALRGDGQISTKNGDISVTAAAECRLHARAISGDITVTGCRVALDARSVSGRVRNH